MGEPVFDPLIQVLSDININEKPEKRAGAAIALGSLGDARAINALSESLNDNDSYIRANSAKHLVSWATVRLTMP
jgi:HEAT repeat protein